MQAAARTAKSKDQAAKPFSAPSTPATTSSAPAKLATGGQGTAVLPAPAAAGRPIVTTASKLLDSMQAALGTVDPAVCRLVEAYVQRCQALMAQLDAERGVLHTAREQAQASVAQLAQVKALQVHARLGWAYVVAGCQICALHRDGNCWVCCFAANAVLRFCSIVTHLLIR